MERERPVSHCGCPKPDDCWGSSGWHFHFLSIEELTQRFLPDDFHTLPDGQVQEVYRMAKRQAWVYQDQWFAYEPCPAYRAEAALQIAQRKALGGPAAPESPGYGRRHG